MTALMLHNSLSRRLEEFQPIDPASNDDAYRRNRRIELKITER